MMAVHQPRGLESTYRNRVASGDVEAASARRSGGSSPYPPIGKEATAMASSQVVEWMWSKVEHLPAGANRDQGPFVQFAQFDKTGLKIRLIRANTKSIRFFAISHVWGDTAWRKVQCTDDDILTSASKAKFIDECLYHLVGETCFWMDTVTVNQRDQAEVISTVQAIPDIFKDAEKTIAITEGDGFETCCAEALHGFRAWNDFDRRLQPHFEGHHGISSKPDSYLRRLWTLQEVTLSHTIQFVAMPQELITQASKTCLDDLLCYGEGWMRVRDALNSLSNAFVARSSGTEIDHSSDKDARSVDFIRAYIEGGTVSTARVLARDVTEDIFSDSFTKWFWASERIATKPRDYVFATMPQFPWYRYPRHAESMTFSEIFSDLALKSRRSGHPFTSRILGGMIDCDTCGGSVESLWMPSSAQPEPECLGDFIKLLAYPVDSPLPGETTAVHFAALATVNLTTCQWEASGASCLRIVKSAINFSSDLWTISHRVGELSKYGSLISRVDLEPFVQTQRNDWRYTLSHGPLSASATETAIAGLTKVLDLLLGAVDEHQVNRPMRSDWDYFSRSMTNAWHPQMQQALFLMAAMISCRVPLSAFKWTYKRFWPVTVALQDGTSCIGMIAWRYVFRLATLILPSTSGLGSDPKGPVVMIAAQHHSDARLKGKDLVLVDAYTKIPIGLVPDFTWEVTSHTDTEASRHVMTERLTKLYGPLISHTVDSGVSAIYCAPLDAVNIQPPS
ncbi:hypothetical protein DOTSEDRAFT_70110 [Dothistroma septosporum NZE10]|uniref:Heterokaryon incompatibility domain-containing protein n=1 Tax=Dothistroma septosporum (strain NZE10 / CBS 128990) TaxID=675120 RepID=N1PUE7_DOTSN|nr:hypothetical protein DOTSEDRAFT_70110 [Dothistroma septosporum NZE10]